MLFSTVLLGLAACESGAPHRLGDANVPLMKPGYGLVATTVIERSRLFSNDQPTGMATIGVTFANFDTARGAEGSAFKVFRGGQTTFAGYVDPTRPEKSDRGYPTFLKQVKPGKYYLSSLTVGPLDNPQVVGPKEDTVFEVKEGEVTYAGSVQMTTWWVERGNGYVAHKRTVEVVDEFARDIPAIKVHEPRLATLPVRNGVARQ
jgi:hypothetical protein